LKEENPEKKQGFANAIAYYMKLTYSNWHKELVHDDNIQTELTAITEGQLEFNNRPFVKHRAEIIERDEYPSRGGYRKNNYGQQQRSNTGGRSNGGGGRDNRGGGRDNRGGSGGSNNRNL
jgi:Domain of unknown function (DUF4290)